MRCILVFIITQLRSCAMYIIEYKNFCLCEQEVQMFYKNAEKGPDVYFYLIYGAENIDISASFNGKKNSKWCIHVDKTQLQARINSFYFYFKFAYILQYFQVSRAAVEEYTGKGEPPYIAMTLKPLSAEATPPHFSLPITLTGTWKTPKLEIERKTEGQCFSLC